MNSFADELLQVAVAEGTILKVAEALDVQPRQIYQWIGGLTPSDRERSQVAERLRRLRMFRHYFERREKATGSAWQR